MPRTGHRYFTVTFQIWSNNLFLISLKCCKKKKKEKERSVRSHSFTSVLYLQISDSVSLGFDEFRDAVLLFFDHGCELLHQTARFLLPLLGLREGRLEPQQLCSHLITNLFDLKEAEGGCGMRMRRLRA